MVMCLVSGIQQDAIDAQQQICINCGFPNNRGTNQWYEVAKLPLENTWYFVKPPLNGWTDGVDSFTQAEMLAGVVNVMDRDIDFNDPDIFPPPV